MELLSDRGGEVARRQADEPGDVVAADYSDDTSDRLGQLFEFGRSEGYGPAEILAIAAQGVNADSPSTLEAEAVAILFGG
jgi:hypothetical protein